MELIQLNGKEGEEEKRFNLKDSHIYCVCTFLLGLTSCSCRIEIHSLYLYPEKNASWHTGDWTKESVMTNASF